MDREHVVEELIEKVNVEHIKSGSTIVVTVDMTKADVEESITTLRDAVSGIKDALGLKALHFLVIDNSMDITTISVDSLDRLRRECERLLKMKEEEGVKPTKDPDHKKLLNIARGGKL